MGAGDNDWPVLITEVSPDRGEMLAALHRLCDWVVTVDRHAGVEYFDSPRDLPSLYEAYLIDCVPERDDLGFLQLITSTSSLDEIVRLLDTALGEMGLSASPRNCTFLLDALKALSGRLALRLTQSGSVAQEMVALALTQSHCAAGGEEGCALAFPHGGLFRSSRRRAGTVPPGGREQGQGCQRTARRLAVCDGGAAWWLEVFVRGSEVPPLPQDRPCARFVGHHRSQLDASCQRWEKLFGPDTTLLEKTVQRARLARVLRFYARKGQRHTLTNEAFECIDKELAKVAREGTGYALPALLEQERAKVGFVFCPEYGGAKPVEIGTDIWLFGPVRST
jgi:DNA phosphorothioation-dependent restriction protein DptH